MVKYHGKSLFYKNNYKFASITHTITLLHFYYHFNIGNAVHALRNFSRLGNQSQTCL